MALPAVIEPCLPSPGERPPTGSGWVHEIKHDGYRLMARRDALSVGIRLLTRNGHDWTTRYPLEDPHPSLCVVWAVLCKHHGVIAKSANYNCEVGGGEATSTDEPLA
jgi:ATP-dependent DNA ligase